MPDAVYLLVKQAIRQALLNGADPGSVRIPGSRQRFVKTAIVVQEVSGQKTYETKYSEGQLPDNMEDFVDAFAEAMSRVIQNLSVISVTATVNGAPAVPPHPPLPGQPNVTITSLVP